MLKGISHYLLPALAILALLVALIPSSSRWLAVAQFKTALFPSQNPWMLNNMGKIAREYPNDLSIQIGSSNFRSPLEQTSDAVNDPSTQIRNLENIVSRFPDQPAAYAIAMDSMILFGVKTGREKDQVFPPDTIQQDAYLNSPTTPPNISLLRKFDEYGIIAERLDPDNAYFPFMRSVALFGLHRDAQANQEIIRASRRPNWNDYINEEVAGRNKLADKTGIGGDSLVRYYMQASILFPFATQLRTSVKIAVHDAMLAEMKGDVQKGFEIRKAVRQIGSLMCTKDNVTIISLVGQSIVEIASEDAAGIPPKMSQSLSGDKRTDLEINHYLQYLNRIKHPEEAVAYRSDIDKCFQFRTNVNARMTAQFGPIDPLETATLLTTMYISWICTLIGSCVFTFRGILITLFLGILLTILIPYDGMRRYRLGFAIYFLLFLLLEIWNFQQIS